jgi:hypothetical protein
MKPRLIHIVFGAILLASIAVDRQAGDVLDQNDDIAPAVIRVAQSHGLTLAEEPLATEQGARRLYFNAPDCGQPVSIAFLSVTMEEEPLMRATGRQSDVVRYAYLDRSWDAPDRFAAFFIWKEHRALLLLGLTPYVATRYMLRVSSPSGCRSIDNIDWQDVWKRPDRGIGTTANQDN